MKLSAVILLCACLSSEAATTYTEWYAIKGNGTNLNAGSTPDANATFTAASGNWTNSTGTFFKTALNPVSGGVTNGAWASVYADATTTNTWFVGMVTNADDTADTIQLSQVAFMGVNPANRVGDCTIKVGGAWAGPNTNTMAAGGGFPFAFLANTATNAPNVTPCCNIKGGTTYGISNAITHALAGPMRFQGYTTTPHDSGRATIDAGSPATSYLLINFTGANIDVCDLIFQNNGINAGSANGVAITSESMLYRCVVSAIRRSGFLVNGPAICVECEAYSCNVSAGAGAGGFQATGGVNTFLRCIAHDIQLGSSAGSGFVLSGSSGNTMVNCIAESNGGQGVLMSSTAGAYIIGCDFYNNNYGIDLTVASACNVEIENCNFLKNAVNGINSSGSSLRNGAIINCAFGSGTQTNSSGGIASNLGGMMESGSITYAADVTPWVDPANGDFRITLAAAKSAGRGSFTQTQSSYTGTIGYPDIGAAQSASTNATTRAFGFSQ